jgi:FKBP-type peptidyl-prolyl cis-trans isomerase
MKKLSIIIFTLVFTSLAFAQTPEGFTVDKSGVIYRVEKSNLDGKPITEGTIVHGHYSVTFGDSLIFDNSSMPAGPMFGAMAANRAFKGDLIDGLFLMKEGETYTFAFTYDSIKKVQQVPPFFKENEYAYYKVEITKAQSMEEFQKEQDSIRKEQIRISDSLQMVELDRVMEYLKANQISNIPFDEIYYKKLSSGSGEKPQANDQVKVHYTGKFLDGKVFDSSVQRNEPISFTIGKGQMIKGFEIGVKLMQKGEKAVIVIPSALAYGGRQRGEIPPYSPLVFELELVDIISPESK